MPDFASTSVIPTLSLKSAPIKYADFAPVQYTAQTSDPTLLSKSLAAQEARRESAFKWMSGIDAELSKARVQLNEADFDWFNKQATAARENVDKEIENGNWQSAISAAQMAGRDLARNDEFLDRAAANKSYLEQRQAIQHGKYSDRLKRWWDYGNKYEYKNSPTWQANFNLVEEQNLNDIFDRAVNATPVRQISTTNSENRDSTTWTQSDGTTSSEPILTPTKSLAGTGTETEPVYTSGGKTVTTSTSHSRTVTEKRENEIAQTIRTRLRQAPNDMAAIRQQFFSLWGLKERANNIKADQQSSTTDIATANEDIAAWKNAIEDKNGIQQYTNNDEGFNKWLEDQITNYAKQMAYKHITTNDHKGINTSYNLPSKPSTSASSTGVDQSQAGQYSPEGGGQAAGPKMKLNEYFTPNITPAETVNSMYN